MSWRVALGVSLILLLIDLSRLYTSWRDYMKKTFDFGGKFGRFVFVSYGLTSLAGSVVLVILSTPHFYHRQNVYLHITFFNIGFIACIEASRSGKGNCSVLTLLVHISMENHQGDLPTL
jgi:hypothetical protein